MGISRRDFVRTTAVGTLVASSGLSTRVFAAGQKTVKIGMNIPMTGDYAPWGLPGLYGCQIVADDLNADGVDIGGENQVITHQVVRNSEICTDPVKSGISRRMTAQAIVGKSACATLHRSFIVPIDLDLVVGESMCVTRTPAQGREPQADNNNSNPGHY